MTSVSNVSGNVSTSAFIKFAIAFVLACCGYYISILMGGEASLSSWIHAPFLGPAIFGGIQWIFWVVLGKELCGKYYGIVIALLMAGFYLMVQPWFNIVSPTWYSIVGVISAIVLGYLTEKYNGAVGLASFVIINWACFAGLAQYPTWSSAYTYSGLGIAFVLSIVSGYVGDIVAKYIAKYLKPHLESYL
ncbi:hypothetical protein [Methanothermococcus okinawensis]|uniref:Uncharacterized protein n=1 Tax=Methanothermococcus okinawensis (strain DSM 14208 / JCM 11175 / IH1) TaxID=647113 RepID=F8AMM6_METOI|nr:hypothetical protein [Methanothermococcus okinawensis]AEH06067.1 hypothetical protein Metok_0069 [Methanothermococcus okinawensis IH1]